jgi:hypothetical protein
VIRSLGTLLLGVTLAALIIVVSFLTAIYILGLTAKAALFGEPRATLAVKLFQRMMKEKDKVDYSDITHITPEK